MATSLGETREVARPPGRDPAGFSKRGTSTKQAVRPACFDTSARTVVGAAALRQAQRERSEWQTGWCTTSASIPQHERRWMWQRFDKLSANGVGMVRAGASIPQHERWSVRQRFDRLSANGVDGKRGGAQRVLRYLSTNGGGCGSASTSSARTEWVADRVVHDECFDTSARTVVGAAALRRAQRERSGWLTGWCTTSASIPQHERWRVRQRFDRLIANGVDG